ncbi:MAG TPA: hypothetical protein PKN75_08595 [Bacteroidia bacterium]|nr:hypothetical protein [Bacteroidia bacterium]HNU33637.1 hypothetical protein [Bacteroidia bacterium]
MKVGFVTEGAKGSPDAKIYPYVAKKFCPQLEVVGSFPLGQKSTVINSSSEEIQKLFELGCEYVFVMWDRMPKWTGGTGKCEDDKQTLLKNLTANNIDVAKIKMGCIDEMTESWMVADGRGVTDYFRNKISTQVPKFEDNKKIAEQAGAQNRIKKHVGASKYIPYNDNFGIVKALPDFDMAARWNKSFADFKNDVSQICS